jgi:hypothetical protein
MNMVLKKSGLVWLLLVTILFISGCQAQVMALPTLVPVASLPERVGANDGGVPPTWTPQPPAETATPGPTLAAETRQPTQTPPPLPTNTAVPPTLTPTPTETAVPNQSPTPDIRPLDQYAYSEVIPLEAFPRPVNDNGWGMHWIPTLKQDRGTVDRFVAEMVRMNIKWVVFLNDGANIGDNDYLVDRLVANGIMPVMRLYHPTIEPYGGDVGAMVRHYRARGVYYYQIYNEPNVNVENHQGFIDPHRYALAWSVTARRVISAGGLPGIGALSPGGEYDHNDFLDRTIRNILHNGDGHLLNRTWLSIHNYHGTRPLDDPGGFLLFRRYNEIVASHLGRSMPMIGTEGGSYHPDPQVELRLNRHHYVYMRNAEPYFLAYSHWLLANYEGGGADEAWEWQSLFRPGFVHPLVTEFFYQNRR